VEPSESTQQDASGSNKYFLSVYFLFIFSIQIFLVFWTTQQKLGAAIRDRMSSSDYVDVWI
jgi:hypothetical protein